MFLVSAGEAAQGQVGETAELDVSSGAAERLRMQANEMGEGAIVRSLCFRWKETAGQLSVLPVIRDAFATLPFSRARLVGTGAVRAVLLKFAFHSVHLLAIRSAYGVLVTSQERPSA